MGLYTCLSLEKEEALICFQSSSCAITCNSFNSNTLYKLCCSTVKINSDRKYKEAFIYKLPHSRDVPSAGFIVLIAIHESACAKRLSETAESVFCEKGVSF